MLKLRILILLLILSIGTTFAQEDESNISITNSNGTTSAQDDGSNISISYSNKRTYTIAGIDVIGIRYLDKDVLIQITGLSVGDQITVPGPEISEAISRLWTHQMFSDIKIEASKIEGNNIWLNIHLQERPRLSGVNYYGLSKSEIDDIEDKVVLIQGSQVTDNQLSTAERLIKDIFLGKGFMNTEVSVVQRDDPSQENSVFIDITVDKKEKVKIQDIVFHGVENLKTSLLERAMKKTNARKLKNILKTKKFQEEKFEEDKINLVNKYYEKGYRDATVVKDSISTIKDGRIRLDIWVDEGDKYYFGDIKWVGNSVYPSEALSQYLGVKKGDVFNQKLLDERLSSDDDAVGNLYLDAGYLYYNLEPVEVNTENDTIDYEMRIYEGVQATINDVTITGNTRTHEQVARRELYTYPGDLYSQTNIKRSMQQLAQLGSFNPEAILPDIVPHPEDGTVDINYNLEEKSNDQITVSGGFGARMFIGTVGLTFGNFSVRNMFDKEAWRPLPTGDGQTLSINAQTSGKFYNTYSISFVEPWLGGIKPNSFSISFSRSKINYSASSYYNSLYSPYGSYGGYGGYGGYGSSYYGGYSPYGYGSSYYGGTSYDPTQTENDKIQKTTSFSIGYGYRLDWPDDYFTVQHLLTFQHYDLQNMASYYYFLSDANDQTGSGQFKNLSFLTSLNRSSIDNPLYTRNGSRFSLSLQFTPPFSLLNGKDYGDPNMSAKERYNWIEFHKWKFSGAWFTPMSADQKLVLMTKFEYGFLGYFDKNRRSPFERFRVGGSGMSGYNLFSADIIPLRGYEDYSISNSAGSNIYNKLTLELRYPVSLKPSATIYVLGFLEGGNAWMDFKNFDPFDLKRSAGLGVRLYMSMFGLMGFDWGYGFDAVNGDKSVGGSQFHFTMGQNF